jgi:hypothetical protein
MLIVSLKYASIVAVVLFLAKAIGAPGLMDWPWWAVFGVPLGGGVVFAFGWAALSVWSDRR